MKKNRLALGLAFIFLCAGAHRSVAQLVTVSYTLRPGWNALLMEVTPTNDAPSAVFGNLPVSEVWGRVEPASSVTFIQDQTESLATRPGWWSWFASTNTPGFLNTLATLELQRPYLVRSTATTNITLLVTGVPNYNPPPWKPNQLNLRSFPIDPATPPTFQNFFKYSPAHYDSVARQVREMYRLNSSGTWVRVVNTDVMNPGEAYWVTCSGASDYIAPLAITTGLPGTLDFSLEATRLTLGLRWYGTNTVQATINDLNPASTALAWQSFNATNGFTWGALASPTRQTVPTNLPVTMTFGMRRTLVTGTNYTTVLALTDGVGTRYLIPVLAQKLSNPGVGPGAAAVPYVGLWVGDARIQAVSEPHSGVILSNSASGAVYRVNTGTNPTPVAREFPLRLLIHVDTNGTAHLLKQVVQMWQDGTYTNDANGNQVIATGGRHVYVTEDSLLGLYKGSAYRDGTMVGRRLSAIGYDFDLGTTNQMPMTGLFAPNYTLAVSLVMPANNPRNPYKHKYHPDHDNLDVHFQPLPAGQEESYTIQRDLTMTFSAADTTGAANPDYGYAVLGGTYDEVIRGLHQMPLYVHGVFELHRVAAVPVLNQ